MKILILSILLSGFGLTSSANVQVQSSKLKNGIELLFIKDKTIPLLQFGLILKNGSTSDPMAKGGLTYLTMNTWMENPALEDEAALVGGEFQHFTSPDYVLIAGSVFSEKRVEFLDIFFRLLTKPVFSPENVSRNKQHQISNIKKLSEEPELFAELAFKSFLFGPHPYGLPAFGKISDIKPVTQREVGLHYKRLFNSNSIIFIITGDFDEDFKNLLKSKLENLPQGLSGDVHWPKPPEIKGTNVWALDAPDATQTQIILGHLGVERKDPDYLKLKVASVILGGSFSSRLNEKIRVQGGLTYNISSEFESELKSGLFQISTSTKNENVERVLKESLVILQKFVEAGVTQEELDTAKNYLIGMLSRSLETPEDHAVWIATGKFYGLKPKNLQEVVDEIKSLTLANVNKAFKDHISSENLKFVVMGPTGKYLKYLQTLGLVELKKF